MARIPHDASVAPAERWGGERRPGARSFVARLFVPLWVCVGLVIAMLVTAGPASAATRSDAEGAPTSVRAISPRSGGAAVDGDHQSHGGSSELPWPCDDVRDPSAAIEVASELEDEDAFETPTAASAFTVLASPVLDRPSSTASAVDTARPLVSTGLGRGPPQQRR